MEVWGAQGGKGPVGGGRPPSSFDDTVGKGGFSQGLTTLSSSQSLYVCVGGKGGYGDTASGGYNGGGSARSDTDTDGCYDSGGGGATHIATLSGILSSLSNSRNSILIVAGGGAGHWGVLDDVAVAGYHGTYQTGVGGGETGLFMQNNSWSSSHCGTQISGGSTNYWANGNGSAGSFGQGGSTSGGSGCMVGGGGGWYGGGGGRDLTGGGSGHIGESVSGSTIAGNTTFKSPYGGTETGHAGNGYAIITLLSH